MMIQLTNVTPEGLETAVRFVKQDGEPVIAGGLLMIPFIDDAGHGVNIVFESASEFGNFINTVHNGKYQRIITSKNKMN